MALTINMVIFVFMIAIETAIPYLAKRTIVFGVTIPERYTKDSMLVLYKKRYSLTVFCFSIITLIGYLIWILKVNPLEDTIVLAGVVIQFVIILLSMSLYFYFHAKTMQRKKTKKWGKDLKEVKVTDLSVRSQDEMLPWYVFLLPIIITCGLIGYTAIQYDSLPQQIPTHWGPNGKPDSFTDKNLFSVHSLSLILLVMQFMFLGINEMTKRSGIKLSAVSTEASRIRQLTLRKYSSWFMILTSVLITMLFSFIQLTTIHSNVIKDALLISAPIIFLIIVLIGTIIFSIKVAKAGVNVGHQFVEGITDVDEDKYWKGGLFYFNKNDPSLFVEKRFGVGWTLNLAHPLGFIILLAPILLILCIAFLS